MAQDMSNVGAEVAQKAVSEMSNAVNKSNVVEDTANLGKRAAEREAEKRAAKLAKEKILKGKSEKEVLDKAVGKAKDLTNKANAKVKNAMRTATSKVRQTAARAAGTAAAVPTAGASKVAGEKAAQVDRQATQARNKAEEQKAKSPSKSSGKQVNEKMNNVAKSGVKKMTGLTDAKDLIAKTSKGADKLNPNAIISGKATGVLKDSMTPKMGQDKNQDQKEER